MGEAKRRQLAVQTQALEAMVVDTPGGRIHVKWDHGASATPNVTDRRIGATDVRRNGATNR